MTLAKLIDELNPQQKQAATTVAHNCLVLAGAGCGKTKTIVARAAYLIDQSEMKCYFSRLKLHRGFQL